MTLDAVDRYGATAVSDIGEHAVVVGGSVAGLLAARVLADGFDRVTIVEKDRLPDGPESRPGVPQGSHIHALQESGRATLDDLFPGYSESITAAGGLLLDGMSDLLFYDEGGFLADGPRRAPLYSATRPLFEASIRRRVVALDGVQLRDGCQFVSYLTDATGRAIEGIEVRTAAGEDERLGGDLVVDATGRGSRTPTWLADHGFAAPPLHEVEIDVAYSTAVVERPSDDRRAILAIASAPNRRGGAVFPVEGDRWLVNIHGVHGDHPPTDAAGFQAFAESLPVPQVASILDGNRWTADSIDFYPFPSSRRYYYERLDRFPEGLVVVGDALASFNPIYGQGMSVAALQALELHHALAAKGTDRLGPRFFDRIPTAIDTAWTMAVGADFQFPETTGPKPRGADLFGRYIDRVMRKAQSDGELRDALFRVISMERSPASLLRPAVAGRVLRPTRSALPTLPGSGTEAADRAR